MIARSFKRMGLVFAADLIMAALSFPISLYLRIGDDIFIWPKQVVVTGLLVFTVVSAGVFLWIRLDEGIWRYSSMTDFGRIVRATIAIIALFVAVQFVFTRLDDFPRSFLVINFFVLTALLSGMRFGYRFFKEGDISSLFEKGRAGQVPVVLIGAGDGSDLFIREMARGNESPYRVVGIIDDRGTRTGRKIRNIQVIGGVDDLEDIVNQLDARADRPQRLIITRAEIDGAAVQSIVETADALGLVVSRMPRVAALGAAKETDKHFDLRPINVEDVLGRPQAVLDRDAMANLVAGKRVLITGAGGTIGGELSRQVAALGPVHISLLDQSEYQLYMIDLELSERAPEQSRKAIIGDTRDRRRLDEVFAEERPEIVFHAAALKHVPLMEENSDDAVLTNVIGSRNVADMAVNHNVDTMVMISTDKAVNPTNVMGATKRLAEAYVQALDIAGQDNGRTRFVTVRFGNVLGSSGSVIPLFQRQLERGGPLTVTDPNMTRYFMTVREAVELVLQASALDDERLTGGGAICVLDMGEPVKILDLAHQMIRLAGLQPGKDIEIAITGLRPGEKLFEEIFHGSEELRPTNAPGILIANPRTSDIALLTKALDDLEQSALDRNSGQTLTTLTRLVPEYAPDDDREPADQSTETG